jgi:hypothetical protein
MRPAPIVRIDSRPTVSAVHAVRRRRRGGLLCGLAFAAACLALPLPAVLAQEPGAGSAPAELPPRVDDWLPRDWWTPTQVVSGRLNDDPYDDLAVLVLRRTEAPEDPDYPRGSRGLFVIFGMPDGGWRRGPMAAGLLPCLDCVNTLGGRIGSAVFDISINDDGLLEIGWVERMRFIKAVRLSIGWDSTYGALGLSADDVWVIRPGQGGRGHVRRDYRAGRIWVDGVMQSLPARFIPIEQVKADQY